METRSLVLFLGGHQAVEPYDCMDLHFGIKLAEIIEPLLTRPGTKLQMSSNGDYKYNIFSWDLTPLDYFTTVDNVPAPGIIIVILSDIPDGDRAAEELKIRVKLLGEKGSDELAAKQIERDRIYRRERQKPLVELIRSIPYVGGFLASLLERWLGL
jgi:hypothetical protein